MLLDAQMASALLRYNEEDLNTINLALDINKGVSQRLGGMNVSCSIVEI